MPASTTIVTPTRRLSRYLRFQYAKEQLQQQKRAWQTPDCLPWGAWCLRLFEQLVLITPQKQQVLGEHQQAWLWQDIINRSRYRQQLLQVNATAKQAMQAYRLARQWAIPVFPEDVFLSDDALAFNSWVREYEQRKREHDWLDEATLPDYLVQHVASLNIDTRIVFQGFDLFTAQQQTLIETLQAAGIEVVQQGISTRNREVAVFAAGDKQAEFRRAACWARETLEANPGASIGVVTPRLRQNRQQLINVFTSVLTPNTLVSPAATENRVWSVALGKPLADYPLIDTALELLSLGRRRVTTRNLGKLLHSPFIKGSEQELARRARLDAALRQAGIEQLNLKSLYRFAENGADEADRCEQFMQLVKDFEISFLSHARQQTLQQWSRHFSEWLTGFGWPGERAISSAEHQTLLAWQDCLHELGKLDPGQNRVGYPAALSQFKRILLDSRFQPETPETPIQITGLDGSAGMQFDYLWLLDMQDDYWPEQTVANAFIPPRLQQEYGVPVASADSRLAYARAMTENLMKSAAEIVFSYSRQEGDRECRPSPLMGDWLSSARQLTSNDSESPAAQIQRSASLETFTDSKAPPIPTDKVASGGSALFRDQSLCPFRAFARHRLHARSLALTDIGLSAAERGTLTHRALQYLWQRLGDQQRLHYLSENERNKLIHSVVNEAIKQQALQQPEIFTDRFTLLEQQRLEQLLQQWLLIEAGRSPFKVIATEDWQTVRFEELELHLRVDRVDELADGRCVIVDYKTGQVRKSDWDTENPNDPQLPLYAVTADQEIAAVAFASLKPGDLKYQGEADTADIIPGIKPDEEQSWPERLEEWRQILARLARDFRDGRATVEPLMTACRYCDLQALCRIYERAETLEAEALLETESDD